MTNQNKFFEEEPSNQHDQNVLNAVRPYLKKNQVPNAEISFLRSWKLASVLMVLLVIIGSAVYQQTTKMNQSQIEIAADYDLLNQGDMSDILSDEADMQFLAHEDVEIELLENLDELSLMGDS